MAGEFIWTYSGRKFFFENPRPEDLVIEDIAHALSLLCRWTGHVQRFYSVAQHSVIVSRLVSPANRLRALFHDAAEAYINDVNKPFKEVLGYDYHFWEAKLQLAINQKLGISEPTEAEARELSYMDKAVALAEARDLLNKEEGQVLYYAGAAEAYPKTIYPWTPTGAEKIFLTEYKELMEHDRSGTCC